MTLPAQVQTQVGAVGGGAIHEIEPECFTLEDAGVFGEEAEENANQEAFKLMACVAACLKRVVETTHDLHRSYVGWVLLLELVLLVSRDEREGVNVFVEVS